MRIAIVCGHFIPHLGYIEVHLAEELGRHHDLCVFTSVAIPSYLKSIAPGESFRAGLQKQDAGYLLMRLPASFSLGQLVVPRGLKEELKKFQPDQVLIIGVGKLFPDPVYDLEMSHCTVTTLFGDNEDTYEKNSSFKGMVRNLIKWFIKEPAYSRAVKASDIIFHYTPSTYDIVENMIPDKLRVELKRKSNEMSLGFNHKQFFFDPGERENKREKLGVSKKEILLITVTRLVRGKEMEQVIHNLMPVLKQNSCIKYLIIGSQEDSYAKEIKELLRKLGLENKIRLLPFMNHAEIREYYNAADIGIWTNTAISIFEALGTGLTLLLPEKQNLSHLKDAGAGYFSTPEVLSDELESIIKSLSDDTGRESKSKKFRQSYSWERIAERILKG